MTIGLRRGAVALVPHETAWEEEAARTIGRLRAILGDAAADIQHVGSTSVKTIAAKPIVDIAVAVSDLDAALLKRGAMESAGFYFRPCDIPEQLLFARGSYYDGTGEEQTHFIHVVKAGGAQWRDYLNFRDYLNAKPAAAKAYETLKLRLAAECPDDAGRARLITAALERSFSAGYATADLARLMPDGKALGTVAFTDHILELL